MTTGGLSFIGSTLSHHLVALSYRSSKRAAASTQQ
jgi:hypothetical protein